MLAASPAARRSCSLALGHPNPTLTTLRPLTLTTLLGPNHPNQAPYGRRSPLMLMREAAPHARPVPHPARGDDLITSPIPHAAQVRRGLAAPLVTAAAMSLAAAPLPQNGGAGGGTKGAAEGEVDAGAGRGRWEGEGETGIKSSGRETESGGGGWGGLEGYDGGCLYRVYWAARAQGRVATAFDGFYDAARHTRR